MPRRSLASTIRRARAGFTLIEVMVVSVILVLVMSLAVPRLGATEERGFENAVDAVADLLLMYAHRDAVGAKAVGLGYDERRGALMMMVLDDQGDPQGRAEWVVDAFTRPYTLPPEVNLRELHVFADGERADLARSPLAHAPGEKRPGLEVLMESASGRYRATLVLPSHAVSPRRTDRNERYAARQSVDLDAAGRSREDW